MDILSSPPGTVPAVVLVTLGQTAALMLASVATVLVISVVWQFLRTRKVKPDDHKSEVRDGTAAANRHSITNTFDSTQAEHEAQSIMDWYKKELIAEAERIAARANAERPSRSMYVSPPTALESCGTVQAYFPTSPYQLDRFS